MFTFIFSLAAVTAVLVRFPATYFQEGHVSPMASQHPIIRWVGAQRDADAGGDMGPGRFHPVPPPKPVLPSRF